MPATPRSRHSARAASSLRDGSRDARRGSTRAFARGRGGQHEQHEHHAINRGVAFPLWMPLLVMAVVTAVGVFLGRGQSQAPTVFFALFAAAAVLCTALVEARGLFVTVASLPVYFFAASSLIAYVTTPDSGPRGGLRTQTLLAVYPAITHFLWLLVPFLLCVLVAAVRWWSFRRTLARRQEEAAQARQRRSQLNRANRDSARRARRPLHAAEEPSSVSTAAAPKPSAAPSAPSPLDMDQPVRERRRERTPRRVEFRFDPNEPVNVQPLPPRQQVAEEPRTAAPERPWRAVSELPEPVPSPAPQQTPVPETAPRTTPVSAHPVPGATVPTPAPPQPAVAPLPVPTLPPSRRRSPRYYID